MPTTLTESATYGGPISVPAPLDVVSATPLRTDALQVLADRTRYLFLDVVGARLAAITRRELVVTADDFSAVVRGPHGSVMAAVACGASGRIQTTQDGETWTARTAAGGYVSTFRCGAELGSGRVAIAGGLGEIETSDDGVTWTQRAIAGGAPATPTWTDMAYGGGIAVVVGWAFSGGTYSPEVQRSTDNGVTWTRHTITAPTDHAAWSVTWTGSRFVATTARLPALSADIRVFTSVDGATWTAATAITEDSYYPQITAFGDRLIVTYDGGIAYSDDIAASWTTVPVTGIDGNPAIMSAISSARGSIVAFAVGTQEVFVSDDGESFFSCGIAPPTPFPGKASYALGRWYAPGTNGHVNESPRAADF